MAEDRTLPGWPKKNLVKDVRRHLSHYGIRPTHLQAWRTTWICADLIACSYWQTHWPLASEIASQYILLLLAEMKKSHMLNLPHRADTVLPAEAAVALLDIQGSGILAFDQSARSTKQRPRRVAAKSGGGNPNDSGEAASLLSSPSAQVTEALDADRHSSRWLVTDAGPQVTEQPADSVDSGLLGVLWYD